MWKQLKAVKRAHSPGVYKDGSRKTSGYRLICIGQRNRLIYVKLGIFSDSIMALIPGNHIGLIFK